MRNLQVSAAFVSIALFTSVSLADGARGFPLSSAQGLTPHNVTVVPSTLAGRKGIRVEAVSGMPAGANLEELVVIDGTDFTDGIIEAEISGAVRADAGEGARGFVGIAFRVQQDLATYDAFYLRPTNGRAEDQLRRNHSAQYISHPEWTWSRLRTETPGQYESYVDLVPGEWTKIRIEVSGTKAKLFVHGNRQPTLIVDLKSAVARGAIALWIDSGTLAHFRDLRITPSVPPQR